ncbi:MAG: fumarylacetoacetate hydrolase family protein [Pseudomonadota bacterium]
MKRFLKIGLGLSVLTVAGMFVAWATSPDPQFNTASFEDEALVERIAPMSEATTLAQFTGEGAEARTLLVLSFSEESVTGIDLVELGGKLSADPFKALASVSTLPTDIKAAQSYPTIEVPIALLLPAGSSGGRHIGTGTNFPEHAEEANSGSVFQFPKFGVATPARTTVTSQSDILLDYEVELCMRFDRDIASLEDFDAATKGVFLCGDFTNRNALVELADPDNLDSGSGFSDSKSGPGHFPTGPFLVIPKDWKAFVSDIRMTTNLNDEPRQDARGGEMTLDFRELVAKSLGDMSEPRFLYRDGYELLAPNASIEQSMTLMSGTSEGVIFTTPSRGDIIHAISNYLLAGGPLASSGFMEGAKATFIENELASGHFLQPGDTVRHGSSYLGNIEVKVVSE